MIHSMGTWLKDGICSSLNASTLFLRWFPLQLQPQTWLHSLPLQLTRLLPRFNTQVMSCNSWFFSSSFDPRLKASSFGSRSLRIIISQSLLNFSTLSSLTSTSGDPKTISSVIEISSQTAGALCTYSSCAVPQAPPRHLPGQPWVQAVHPAAGWGE